MGKLATGHIFINGLYEMGDGWNKEVSDLWDEFWGEQEKNATGLIVCHRDSSWGKQFYICGLGISIYLHPLMTNFTFETSNSAEQEKFTYDMEDIAKFLNELKDFMADHSIKMTWKMDWNVHKEVYVGAKLYNFEPDFNGEIFTLESK